MSHREILDNGEEVPSEAFLVPVAEVLAHAATEGFSSVVVIGLDDDGEAVVAGSHGTPQVRSLVEAGLRKIDELEEED